MTTLPGTIPGLLRANSPAIANNRGRAIVFDVDVDHDGVLVYLLVTTREAWLSPADVALDLTDPTGRVHAAWWLAGSDGVQAAMARMGRSNLDRLLRAVERARMGQSVSAEEVDLLRTTCLAAAGMEPA